MASPYLSKAELFTQLREKATVCIFAVLDMLDIRASLSGMAGMALHDPYQCDEGGKDLSIMVEHPDITMEDLLQEIVDRNPDNLTLDKEALYFKADDETIPTKFRPQIHMFFFRDLCEEPNRFPQSLLIDEIPVLPLPYILCLQLQSWENKPGSKEQRRVLLCVRSICKKPRNSVDLSGAFTFFPHSLRQLDLISLKNANVANEITKMRKKQCMQSGVPIPPMGRVSTPGPGATPSEAAHAHRAGSVSPLPTDASRSTTPIDLNDPLKSIATEIIGLLRDMGLDCALLGSMACKLYGNERPPQDLEILLIPPSNLVVDLGSIEEHLVEICPRLYFNIPQESWPLLYQAEQATTLPAGSKRSECKVNILLPGIMDVPTLSIHQVNIMNGLPVVPFLLVLLQQLRQWHYHLQSPELDQFRNHLADAQDIKALLLLAPNLPMRLVRPWSEKSTMSLAFQQSSVDRVREFWKRYPETFGSWQGLGFE